MGVVVSVALRALAPVAIVLAVSATGCGDVTFAPDAGSVVRDAGPAASPPSVSPHAGMVGPGGTGCMSDADCHGKLNHCAVGSGACVACLTDHDCDGDHKCTAGICAGGKD